MTLHADEASSPALAFRQAGSEFHFDTGVLRGTLRAAGRSRGLGPVQHIATGKQLAGALGLLSPYRLLTPESRFGTAAWDWASRARLLENGAVEVRWTADKDHPLDMTAVYRLAAADTVDLLVTVHPQKDQRQFELFLASYFDGFPPCFAYAREGAARDGGNAGFVEATQTAGGWQMFPRDDQAAVLIRDGRWRHPPNPVNWVVRSPLAAPLAVRRDAGSGLTALIMAPTADCFAVAMPYTGEGHRSLYLSLLGRDLQAGQPATARARLVVTRDFDDDKAAAVHRKYERCVASDPDCTE